VTYFADTLVAARSCTATCAPKNRVQSSRSRERSTSKARRAREVSEIEPAPPWPLISKEMTQPHEVEEPQASQASGRSAPAITPAPVRTREEQNNPTVVSFADPDDLPEEFFLAETSTEVKWLWPAWCFQQDPPCIEVCVFEDEHQEFHWLKAVGQPPPAVGSVGENYLAAEYGYRNKAFLQEFHPSHVRKIGEERTVADILVDGE